MPADEQLILRFKASIKSGSEKLAEALKCTVSLQENGTVLYDDFSVDICVWYYYLCTPDSIGSSRESHISNRCCGN